MCSSGRVQWCSWRRGGPTGVGPLGGLQGGVAVGEKIQVLVSSGPTAFYVLPDTRPLLKKSGREVMLLLTSYYSFFFSFI